MELYGNGKALQAMAENYFGLLRGSGRTTRLLDTLKDGDRVIFCEPMEADRFKRQARERGLIIECMVIPVNQASKLHTLRPVNKTLFDHEWVERFYLDSIKDAEKFVSKVQDNLSSSKECYFAEDGTMMNSDGTRSIFDDVDQ